MGDSEYNYKTWPEKKCRFVSKSQVFCNYSMQRLTCKSTNAKAARANIVDVFEVHAIVNYGCEASQSMAKSKVDLESGYYRAHLLTFGCIGCKNSCGLRAAVMIMDDQLEYPREMYREAYGEEHDILGTCGGNHSTWTPIRKRIRRSCHPCCQNSEEKHLGQSYCTTHRII